MTYTLHHGDCLDILPTLPAQSVDAIIADPPYGTTACKWDSVIPLDAMWRELKRVIKPNGAIVLFGAQPFTSVLVTSNLQWFKYRWVWDKANAATGLHAKIMPMRVDEEVIVFGSGLTAYNPQMSKTNRRVDKKRVIPNGEAFSGNVMLRVYDNKGVQYPKSIIRGFSNSDQTGKLHPTQKPVDLMRYLVRTYTNAGETVLDFTAGSGSTGVAALLEGRRFIGIEKDAGYYAIMERRCSEAIAQPALVGAAE